MICINKLHFLIHIKYRTVFCIRFISCNGKLKAYFFTVQGSKNLFTLAKESRLRFILEMTRTTPEKNMQCAIKMSLGVSQDKMDGCEILSELRYVITGFIYIFFLSQTPGDGKSYTLKKKAFFLLIVAIQAVILPAVQTLLFLPQLKLAL